MSMHAVAAAIMWRRRPPQSPTPPLTTQGAPPLYDPPSLPSSLPSSFPSTLMSKLHHSPLERRLLDCLLQHISTIHNHAHVPNLNGGERRREARDER